MLPAHIAAHRSIPTCVGFTSPPRGTALPCPVHPHVRGVHWEHVGTGRLVDGPSPRAWGSRPHPGHPNRPRRSIPTCVGFTTWRGMPSPIVGVHPHVRGARAAVRRGLDASDGPSPRAWGSAARSAGSRRVPRSIPTCVGLGEPQQSPAPWSPVHPHVRGARAAARLPRSCWRGPSPRAWGSVMVTPVPNRDPRSIPTCVGLGRRETNPGWASAASAASEPDWLRSFVEPGKTDSRMGRR